MGQRKMSAMLQLRFGQGYNRTVRTWNIPISYYDKIGPVLLRTSICTAGLLKENDLMQEIT